MIEQINVRNFRCFQDLEVADLRRVNLLVGSNSSGKSAFMEAIFLSSSSVAAHGSLQLRAIRRMGNQLMNPNDAISYRGIWEDLFFEFNQERKISIKVGGNPNADSRNLFIEYVSSSAQELPFGKQTTVPGGNLQSATVMPQIEFKWKRNGFPDVISRPKFTPTGMQVDPSNVSFFPALWFTAGSGESPEDSSRRFSELDKHRGMEIVTEIVTREFPFIRGFSIQYHAGLPILFAEVKGNDRKMPVALISDGVNRLLSICVGIAYFKGGCILIDQLEDGFHYKLLPSIWKSIYALAQEYKVQLFVSTHSKECMEALLPTIAGNESDFSLLRASRTDPGCTIKSLGGDYLESALEQDFEVR